MAGKVVLQVLRHVWSNLSTLPYPLALMGGLALAFWQRNRTTADVDVLIGVDHNSIGSVLETLQRAGMRPKREPALLDLGSVRIVQLLYEPSGVFVEIQVDLLLAESAFHQQALARRVPARLEGLDNELFVVSCEDLLLFKLSAGRIIDRADAAELLRLHRSSLDFAYLGIWVIQLNLSTVFAEIWQEACPGEPIPAMG
jgi:hypothetical protein